MSAPGSGPLPGWRTARDLPWRRCSRPEVSRAWEISRVSARGLVRAPNNRTIVPRIAFLIMSPLYLRRAASQNHHGLGARRRCYAALDGERARLVSRPAAGGRAAGQRYAGSLPLGAAVMSSRPTGLCGGIPPLRDYQPRRGHSRRHGFLQADRRWSGSLWAWMGGRLARRRRHDPSRRGGHGRGTNRPVRCA